jgi:hypothetical protein
MVEVNLFSPPSSPTIHASFLCQALSRPARTGPHERDTHHPVLFHATPQPAASNSREITVPRSASWPRRCLTTRRLLTSALAAVLLTQALPRPPMGAVSIAARLRGSEALSTVWSPWRLQSQVAAVTPLMCASLALRPCRTRAGLPARSSGCH